MQLLFNQTSLFFVFLELNILCWIIAAIQMALYEVLCDDKSMISICWNEVGEEQLAAF